MEVTTSNNTSYLQSDCNGRLGNQISIYATLWVRLILYALCTYLIFVIFCTPPFFSGLEKVRQKVCKFAPKMPRINLYFKIKIYIGILVGVLGVLFDVLGVLFGVLIVFCVPDVLLGILDVLIGVFGVLFG